MNLKTVKKRLKNDKIMKKRRNRKISKKSTYFENKIKNAAQ